MLVLERFEGDYALIENGEVNYLVECGMVAPDVKEGDVLRFINNIYYRDEDETTSRRGRILRLQEGLWK